jgi:hypothetical protein
LTDGVGNLFLAQAVRESRTLEEQAHKAIEQVEDTAFFARLDPESNPIAINVKHLAGNMRSRWTEFLTTDGEKADRDRDREFELLPGDTRENLLTRFRDGWQTLFAALEPLSPADLERTVLIRGEPLPVLRAITRQLTHYGYHVGQIVLLAKHSRGPAWHTLSIPRHGSDAFNARMREWLGGKC